MQQAKYEDAHDEEQEDGDGDGERDGCAFVVACLRCWGCSGCVHVRRGADAAIDHVPELGLGFWVEEGEMRVRLGSAPPNGRRETCGRRGFDGSTDNEV